jgi:hypothetical protein
MSNIKLTLEIEQNRRNWPRAFAAVALSVSSVIAYSASEIFQDDASLAEANAGSGLAAGEMVCAASGAIAGEFPDANITQIGSIPGYGVAGSSSINLKGASTTNISGPEANPNAGTFAVNPDGKLCYISNQPGDVLIDVTGYTTNFRPAKADNTAKRILDTRTGTGQPGLAAGEMVCAASGAIAGEFPDANITQIGSIPGYGVAGSSSINLKGASTTNISGPEANPNAGTFAVNPDGKLCYISNQPGDVLIDVTGYTTNFRPAKADNTAKRILDTRTGTGQPGLAAGEMVCAASGAIAGEFPDANITQIGSIPGYGVAGSSSINLKGASTTNISGPEANPNAGTFAVNPDGKLCYISNQPGDVLIDVTGYTTNFRPAKADNTAKRILDTRQSVVVVPPVSSNPPNYDIVVHEFFPPIPVISPWTGMAAFLIRIDTADYPVENSFCYITLDTNGDGFGDDRRSYIPKSTCPFLSYVD